ncbi:hypothetical protein GCM10009563_12170 [Subtercola frigoramans]
MPPTGRGSSRRQRDASIRGNAGLYWRIAAKGGFSASVAGPPGERGLGTRENVDEHTLAGASATSGRGRVGMEVQARAAVRQFGHTTL